MARALRRAGLVLSLPALVGASTVLHWLAGRRLTGLWIMPDEAIYGERAVAFWHHLSLPVLNGQGAGYSVLYPVVAGIPLAVGKLSTGYASLKLLQALVMSLAAVPVFHYGRRLMPNGWALVAAALTVANPIVLFSGYLMTEVLYYPVAACATFAIAAAVARPSLRANLFALAWIGLAVLTRMQAVVLLPVFASAAVVDAAFSRTRARLSSYWLLWACLAVAALAGIAAPRAFGAYEDTLRGGYSLLPALRLVGEHFSYLVVMCGVAPAVAFAMLGVGALAGRERDPFARALIAVTACSVVLTVLQVGVFSSRYAPHLLGRDLAALPPPLIALLALWLARRAPGGRLALSAVALAVAGIVAVTPWNDLVTAVTLPDSPGLASALDHPYGWAPALSITVGAAVVLAVVRLLPRGPAVPLLVLAFFVWDSVVASNLVTRTAAADQVKLVGTPRNWIDLNADGPVTYVYDGDIEIWTVVWEQQFWNRRLEHIVSLLPDVVAGPADQTTIPLPPDGLLPTGDRYVVARNTVTFDGTRVATQSRGGNEYPLVLWRLDGPARVSTITDGVLPNGDMYGHATVTVPDCAGGSLQLTLLPKATNQLRVQLDGRTVASATVTGAPSWSDTIPVPPDHAPKCTFTILGGPLLGSTRIAFARPSS